MDAYTDIWDYATDHHGIITTKEAERLGITKQHLVKMADRGALCRLGRGVYQVKHHVFSELDSFVNAVAVVGESAYLMGASVIAMFGLCPTNPSVVYVGSAKRVRRRLPPNIRLHDMRPCTTVLYDGIRSESVYEALRTAKLGGAIEDERIASAAMKALEKGLVTDEQSSEFQNKS